MVAELNSGWYWLPLTNVTFPVPTEPSLLPVLSRILLTVKAAV